jgi:hypothetical protein
MRALGAVELRYADEHVPLAMLLGAVGALSTLRRLLPAGPGAREPTTASAPDAFVLLLLGAIVTSDRLDRLCAGALATHDAVPAPVRPGRPPDAGGILR